MTKKKTVTIQDIAREAGVSLSTVSRVISGGAPVTPEKQAAVRAAAERLQYPLPAQADSSEPPQPRQKPKKRMITIIDIARQADVSPSTVSRVLAGQSGIDSEKVAAVQQAVKQLNYRPNVVARGLVLGSSHAIGVLTQNMDSLFYASIVQGIEQGLRKTGYHPIYASGNWVLEEEKDALEVLISRRVDGLIVLGGQIPDADLRLVAEELPIIVVGRKIAGLEDRCLVIDNVQGGEMATRYLLSLGHTRIAHITGELSQPDALERAAGYRQALAAAGIEVNPQLVVEGRFSEQAGILGIETLIARGVPFTALFAASDPIATGALLALFRHGIRVPVDISVIGFDDQAMANYTVPPLTTIRQPAFGMGQEAAQAMIRILQGAPLDLPRFSLELVIRESARMLSFHRGS
jgi:LacI family transcriptional regulator